MISMGGAQEDSFSPFSQNFFLEFAAFEIRLSQSPMKQCEKVNTSAEFLTC